MCYDRRMTLVAARELRNNTRGVLARVEGGDDVTITVDGRPVAVLHPVERRRRWISRQEFVAIFNDCQADAGLLVDLRGMAGEDSTDDVRW